MSPLLIMLLASAGPLMLGFIGLNDDPVDDTGEDEPAQDDPSDPVATVDVASFIESARSFEGDLENLDGSRGTDDDEVFVAAQDVKAAHDASGGEDRLEGSNLQDTLIGGAGEDTLEGGEGGDVLFGGFIQPLRDDDSEADVMDGGAGDDTIFMGEGDSATGGEGSDVFATLRDVEGTVTITDFDVEEDALAVETEEPDGTTVTDQVVDEDGVLVQLSNGVTIRLTGLTELLPEGAVQFVQAAAPEEEDMST